MKTKPSSLAWMGTKAVLARPLRGQKKASLWARGEKKHSMTQNPPTHLAVAQKAGIPKCIALVSGNRDDSTCGLPLRSFNFEPSPKHQNTTGRALGESLWRVAVGQLATERGPAISTPRWGPPQPLVQRRQLRERLRGLPTQRLHSHGLKPQLEAQGFPFFS